MGRELRQGMDEWFFTSMFQSNEVTWWYSSDDWLVWRFQESFTHRSATLAGMPRQQGSMVFPARRFQDNQLFLHGSIELLRVCSKTSGWRLETSYDVFSKFPEYHFHHLLFVKQVSSCSHWQLQDRLCSCLFWLLVFVSSSGHSLGCTCIILVTWPPTSYVSSYDLFAVHVYLYLNFSFLWGHSHID